MPKGNNNTRYRYDCLVCGNPSNVTIQSLRKHLKAAHDLNEDDYCWKYVESKESRPVCIVENCGKSVNFRGIDKIATYGSAFRECCGYSCANVIRNRDLEFKERGRIRSSELGKKVMSKNGLYLAQFRRDHNGRTPAEDKLYHILINMGYNVIPDDCRFPGRRMDLTLPEYKLDIELDGFSHKTREHDDILRSEYIRSHGWNIIRFSNQKIYNNINDVVKEIEDRIKGH